MAVKRPTPGIVEPPDEQSGFRDRLQLALDGVNAFLEFPDLAHGLGEREPEQPGHAGVGVFEERPNVRHDMMRTRWDHHPEFPQEPAHGIEARRARGEPGGAEAVQGRERLLGLRLHRPPGRTGAWMIREHDAASKRAPASQVPKLEMRAAFPSPRHR